ncbi:MAG: hypothetical protein HYU25_15390 [Candidatus Rokubacteria bacterium]|nr:hypothetical protein [Candidatus Rokubacteria bacterium]
MGDDDLRQIAPAQRAREHAGARIRDPTEPVGVLTSLTGDDVLAAAEKQDRLGVRVAKVDVPLGAGDSDPSIDPELCIRVGAESPIPTPSLWLVGAGSDSPVREPAVDDHLDRRIFLKRAAQRPTRVKSCSRDDNEKRALTVLHINLSLVKLKLTPKASRNMQELSATLSRKYANLSGYPGSVSPSGGQ